ncbi:MAG: DUF6384 family protein [Pseudomonadota bacterium]
MTTPGPGGAGEATKPPLDDVMLAMDVVDTLRRKRRLVEKELDVAGRELDLKDRLRRIYTAQGIEVSDAVLEEGVQALKQDRFVYRPPPESLGVRLAQLYVTRGLWGKWVMGALALVAVGVIAWILLVVGPRGDLPQTLQNAHADVVELARDAAVDQQADQLLASARNALRADDIRAARAALADLQQLRDQLAAAYRVQVVNRPGEPTGVWRVPDVNQTARNYYIIVEAVGPGDRPLEVLITSEETGRTEPVRQWGLRVDRSTFERIAADKSDDGIIQNDVLGRKRPGLLEPEYQVETSGAAITDW